MDEDREHRESLDSLSNNIIPENGSNNSLEMDYIESIDSINSIDSIELPLLNSFSTSIINNSFDIIEKNHDLSSENNHNNLSDSFIKNYDDNLIDQNTRKEDNMNENIIETPIIMESIITENKPIETVHIHKIVSLNNLFKLSNYLCNATESEDSWESLSNSYTSFNLICDSTYDIIMGNLFNDHDKKCNYCQYCAGILGYILKSIKLIKNSFCHIILNSERTRLLKSVISSSISQSKIISLSQRLICSKSSSHELMDSTIVTLEDEYEYEKLNANQLQDYLNQIKFDIIVIPSILKLSTRMNRVITQMGSNSLSTILDLLPPTTSLLSHMTPLSINGNGNSKICRQTVMECILIMLNSHKSYLIQKGDHTALMLESIETVIKNGLNDQDSNVRDTARKAAKIIINDFKDRSTGFITSLSPQVIKYIDVNINVASNVPDQSKLSYASVAAGIKQNKSGGNKRDYSSVKTPRKVSSNKLNNHLDNQNNNTVSPYKSPSTIAVPLKTIKTSHGPSRNMIQRTKHSNRNKELLTGSKRVQPKINGSDSNFVDNCSKNTRNNDVNSKVSLKVSSDNSHNINKNNSSSNSNSNINSSSNEDNNSSSNSNSNSNNQNNINNNGKPDIINKVVPLPVYSRLLNGTVSSKARSQNTDHNKSNSANTYKHNKKSSNRKNNFKDIKLNAKNNNKIVDNIEEIKDNKNDSKDENKNTNESEKEIVINNDDNTLSKLKPTNHSNILKAEPPLSKLDQIINARFANPNDKSFVNPLLLNGISKNKDGEEDKTYNSFTTKLQEYSILRSPMLKSRTMNAFTSMGVLTPKPGLSYAVMASSGLRKKDALGTPSSSSSQSDNNTSQTNSSYKLSEISNTARSTTASALIETLAGSNNNNNDYNSLQKRKYLFNNHNDNNIIKKIESLDDSLPTGHALLTANLLNNNYNNQNHNNGNNVRKGLLGTVTNIEKVLKEEKTKPSNSTNGGNASNEGYSTKFVTAARIRAKF